MNSSRSNRVAVVRGAEWDATQAIPRTLDALKQLGATAEVLCWDKSGQAPARETIDGVAISRFRRYVPPRSAVLFLYWPIWWVWLMVRLVRGRFDVVHAMDIDTLIPAVLARPLGRYRLIYDSRDALGLVLANVRWPAPQTARLLDRIFSSFADGLLLSQGDIAACADYFGRRTRQRVPVVQVLNLPTAPPPDSFRSPTARPLRINVSGYISPPRGGRVLIDAFAGRDDVQLDVVGEMRYPDLERGFAAMANATVYGRVPYAQALALMDQADLIWLHYDNSLENVAIASANKMFEAMMLGKPYLTADGSWMETIARRFELGFSLPYDDRQALLALATQLNEEPHLLVRAGLRGRATFERYFTWPRHRENILTLYRHVLRQADPAQQRPCMGWERLVGHPPADAATNGAAVECPPHQADTIIDRH